MTEPIRCPRCRRAFGGQQAFNRGHRRYHGDGEGRREKCRPIRELRGNPYLRLDDDGVWHARHRDDLGQLMLPLFRHRGRPRHKPFPTYVVGTRNRHRYVVRPRVPKRPEITVEAA